MKKLVLTTSCLICVFFKEEYLKDVCVSPKVRKQFPDGILYGRTQRVLSKSSCPFFEKVKNKTNCME